MRATNFRRHLSQLTLGCLFLIFPRVALCDYTQGGTLLSWEWLTDVSGTIVVGEVSEDGEEGFRLEVELVLKKTMGKLAEGDIVGGPTFGRTNAYFGNQGKPEVAQALGWPVLSDYLHPKRTDRPQPNEVALSPSKSQSRSWEVGDRCMVFYLDGIVKPIQIINLDRPMTIEVPVLAVNVLGNSVADADQLITSIRERLAKARVRDAKDRTRKGNSAYGALHYIAWNGQVDGGDYWGVVVPANEPAIFEKFKAERESASEPPMTSKDAIWNSDKVDSFGAWKYWFDEGKQAPDFSKDAVLELRLAIEYCLASRPHFAKAIARTSTRKVPKVAHLAFESQGRLYDGYSKRILTNRSYPLGWNTQISFDGYRFAFIDANKLRIYEIDQASRSPGLNLYQDRKCNIVNSKMQFSHDSTLLAYNRTDGSFCVVNALDGKPLWTSKPPTMPKMYPGERRQTYSAGIYWSYDSKYVAQHLYIDSRTYPQLPVDNAYHRQSKILIWNAQTGELEFSPYKEFKKQLKFLAFDLNNSDLIGTEVKGRRQSWCISQSAPANQ